MAYERAFDNVSFDSFSCLSGGFTDVTNSLARLRRNFYLRMPRQRKDQHMRQI